jgi:excisionase family DNA binding protein
MDSHERLFTPQELAKQANCSPATINREIHRGRLRAIRIGAGRLLRVPESAWREYLDHAADLERLSDDDELWEPASKK